MAPDFHEIRIENTNACGYSCVMCPREKQTRSIGRMSLEDFSLVLDRIGSFEKSVHLHGFGEPLLDRSLPEKIQILKQKWPKASSTIFSTLGVRLSKEAFRSLAAAGLGELNVSLYGFTRESYARVHGVDGFERVQANLKVLSEAIKESGSSLKVHVKVPSPDLSSSLPLSSQQEGVHFCTWVQSLGFEVAVWPALHNYGDGRSFNAPGKGKLCPVIEGKRKKILNITWDLAVIPCCFDFNATIRFGNLRRQSLDEIFSSPEYLSFTIAHRTDALTNYPVCIGCEKKDWPD